MTDYAKPHPFERWCYRHRDARLPDTGMTCECAVDTCAACAQLEFAAIHYVADSPPIPMPEGEHVPPR